MKHNRIRDGPYKTGFVATAVSVVVLCVATLLLAIVLVRRGARPELAIPIAGAIVAVAGAVNSLAKHLIRILTQRIQRRDRDPDSDVP